jgi:hypothetical protein
VKDKVFRLVIVINSSTEKKINYALNEFGKIVGKGEISNSVTKEYFKCVESKDAVNKLASLQTA